MRKLWAILIVLICALPSSAQINPDYMSVVKARYRAINDRLYAGSCTIMSDDGAIAGTAWCYDDDPWIFVTNRHVHQAARSKETWSIVRPDWPRIRVGVAFIAEASDADIAIFCRWAPMPDGCEVSPLTATQTAVAEDEPLFMMGNLLHGRDDVTYVGHYVGQIGRRHCCHLEENFSGSSGSPIVNLNCEVIGIHCAEGTDPRTGQGLEVFEPVARFLRLLEAAREEILHPRERR